MKNISYFLVFSFVASLLAAQQPSQAFKNLDRNNDGKLTADEFPGPLFKRIDTDGDGIITNTEDSAFQRVKNRPPRGPRLPESIVAELDIPYADTTHVRQRLDLYLPKVRNSDKPLPVVVFIHGGAWLAGDKKGGYGTVGPLVETGHYAGISVGYRLSSEAIWPAQIHDCKAAIRWIRGNAKKYNLDPEKIGVTGSSAGGHLVAMLGTSGDVKELDGTLGNYLDQSSRVTCVVDQFGPSDLLTMAGSHNNSDSPESRLVGGPIQQNKEMAKSASPTSYVTADDPPFMLIHGAEDPLVPYSQSELLDAELKKVGVPSLLIKIVAGKHGNFGSPEVPARVMAFFDRYLRGTESPVSTEAISIGVR